MTVLYIDADACPVKDEAYKVAARYRLKTFVVSNAFMRVPVSPLIEQVVVDAGPDVADDWIAEHVVPGDIAVTNDIPLAERVLKAGGHAIKPNGERFTAGDLMNPEILTVDADMTVRELAAFLVENEISGAPVQDDEGRIVGVVSLVDVAAVHSEGEEDAQRTGLPFARGHAGEPDGDGGRDSLTVADIMTPMVYSVTEDAAVSEIASAT